MLWSLLRCAQLFAAAGAVIVAAAGSANADDYPNHVVRIVVPYPAGGPSDTLARLVAQQMTETWKQPVIIENRPGANTIVAAEVVAKAAPDGYTLLQAGDSTLAMNQSIYNNMPYDPARDFSPVTLSSWNKLIMLTNADTGPKSVEELIAWAKADPGKYTFGAGNLTTRLGGELFTRMAGVKMQFIPYRGSAGSVRGLLTRDVTVTVDGLVTGLPHVQSGRFRVLANLSSEPIAAMPDLPMMSKVAGMKDYNAVIWNGLVAPAGTPADIRQKIQREVARIYAIPEIHDKLVALGVEPATMTPDQFGAFIANERTRWSAVIKDAGIKPE